MPDPGGKRDKRARLIHSAQALLHQQGVQKTTLADVAEKADVPLGNVYYYFKTKDELVGAVIARYADQVQDMLTTLERRRSPAVRLKMLANSWAEMREAVARYGCPMGTLCSELDKGENGLGPDAAKLLARIVDWAEEQFRQIGTRNSRDHAIALVAGIQGAALLAQAFGDPEILTRETRRLGRWIETTSVGAGVL